MSMWVVGREYSDRCQDAIGDGPWMVVMGLGCFSDMIAVDEAGSWGCVVGGSWSGWARDSARLFTKAERRVGLVWGSVASKWRGLAGWHTSLFINAKYTLNAKFPFSYIRNFGIVLQATSEQKELPYTTLPHR